MKLLKNANVKNAVYIGTLCSISYLMVYVARNILSAVTPKLVESGTVTNEYIGVVSSTFFMFYAVGQLVNGILGDKIKGKYMVSLGFLLAGISNLCFMFFMKSLAAASLVYGLFGFFLSMIYAPMVKTISENTNLLHAERCNLALSFAALFGTPAAGLIAGLFMWRTSFWLVCILLWLMAVLYFVVNKGLEKTGAIKYDQYERKVKQKQKGGVQLLLQRGIIPFTIISALTGIVRTSVVFWLPTYISQHLGFSSDIAAFIFTVVTAAISVSTFFAMFVYERLQRNMKRTILLSFLLAAVSFAALFFIKIPFLNVLLITIAIMASNSASTMIWVVYCPGLRDTGMVSTATGYLDFISYMAGAVSNVIFANAVSAIGWGNLILVWLGLMAAGVVTSLTTSK